MQVFEKSNSWQTAYVFICSLETEDSKEASREDTKMYGARERAAITHNVPFQAYTENGKRQRACSRQDGHFQPQAYLHKMEAV